MSDYPLLSIDCLEADVSLLIQTETSVEPLVFVPVKKEPPLKRLCNVQSRCKDLDSWAVVLAPQAKEERFTNSPPPFVRYIFTTI